MRLVVDTGVFSATLNRRRQPAFDEPVRRLQGHQIFLAAVTVAELRAACRQVGHPLADRIHANDLWIAARAVHIAAALVTVDSIFEGAPGLLLAQ